MSDQGVPILEGIDTRLATVTGAGQTLEDIATYYVDFSNNEKPPDFGTAFPALLVDMLPMSGETVSIPPIMTRKTYPVRFRLYTEQAGYTRDKTGAQLIDLVEDAFFQQRFSISNLLVDFTTKNYTIPAEIPFAAQLNGGGTLILTYRYTDTRAIP